jgi:CubicO group peptidase (beta-lactamase class C family)
VKLLAASALAAFLTGAAASAQVPSEGYDEPDEDDIAYAKKNEGRGLAVGSWERSDPEREGMDAAKLAALHQEIAAGKHGNINELLVIRHGAIVAEHHYKRNYKKASAGRDRTSHQYNYYDTKWHPYRDGHDEHTLQSVTKSITSALIGIAIARGEIPGVHAPALAMLGDRKFDDPDGRKATIKLEDLLTMRAGIAWDETSVPYTDPRNDCAQMEASKDWVQFVLDQPMAADPGTVWVYSSGVSQLLSAILRARTGETADEYAEEHLFGPLGIHDFYWKKTPDGLPDTEGGLYLEPQDLARIGRLFLKNGAWEGRQVLTADWVRASTSPAVRDVNPANGVPDWSYGYQWWLREGVPEPFSWLIAARGYGGQYLLVVPNLDLITVINAWDIYDRQPQSMDLFTERILTAIE